LIHADACCTSLANQVLLKGSTGMEITACKIQTAGVMVNEQHPSYGTLTGMVHLAMWHAIHFCTCGVLYTQVTDTRSETWQCEASCSCLGYRNFATSSIQKHHPWCYGRS